MLSSPSLPLHDLDDLSSPDPLANSLNDRLPVATRSPTRSPSPPKRRLSSPAKTSRSKRSLQQPSSPLSSHSFVPPPVSPSRTVTEQTLSPWKIRVTVEAEHEDGEEAGGTMTRTIKVPLREESSPLNSEHITGRGRRSAPSSARMKRSGTPVGGRSGSPSRSRRQSVTDLSFAPLGDDGDSDEWTAKKRSPRKKRAPKKQRAQSEQSDGIVLGDDVESAGPLSESGNQRSGTSPPFEIHEDVDAAPGFGYGPSADQPSPSVSQSPELRQIDLNRVSVRPRSQSTKRKESRPEWSDKIHGSEIGLGAPPPSTRVVSASSAASYPTPSPTSSYHGSDDVEKAAEPTHEHENFNTMLESEGFTMIDLGTIPSARQFRTSPEEQKSLPQQMSEDAQNRPANHSRTPETKMLPLPSSQKKPTPVPSNLTMADDESELSSNVPSSPPPADTSIPAVPTRPLRSSDRKVTPQLYSSRSLPPPPPVQKVPSGSDRPESPPQEVLDAGVALQDAVISPNDNSSTSAQMQSSESPSFARGNFFNGFSSGTKRELRAGLRFGEELAKRQTPSSTSSSQVADKQSASGQEVSLDRAKVQIKPQLTTQVWRGETFVQHSPFATDSLPQTKKSDHKRSPDGRMGNDSLFSSKTTTANASSRLASSSTQTPQTSLPYSNTPELNTAARREHEWQLEREAVSRQIENANPSKVVIIDSDDDENVPNARTSRTNDRSVEGEQKQKEPPKGGPTYTEEVRRLPSGAKKIRGGAMEETVQNRHLDEEARRSSLASNSNSAEEEEDEDVWLQEAKDNSSSPRDQDTASIFTRTEQQRQRDRAAEVINKPRRSLIPSPWKRGQDVAEASTLMSDGAMSGFFWQQQTPVQEAIKFGAGEIARQKRQSSGNFDLETMLSSPVKLAAVGRRNLTLRKSDNCEKYEEDVSDEVEDEEVEDDGNQAENISEEEESQQDVSGVAESETSSPSSQLPPQTVPVNFNDSTLSGVATPPRQMRPTPAEAAERARFTPPRSAMKGARLSFSPPKQEPPSEIRRVVFNERSLYLNSDGDESSMSAHLDSPLPEPKAGQQFQSARVDKDVEQEVEHQEWVQRRDKRSSWLGWMLRGNTDESTATHADSTASIPRVDGPAEVPTEDDNGFSVEDEADEVEDGVAEESEHWRSTKTAFPTSNGSDSTTRARVDHRPSYSPLTDAEADVHHQPQPHQRLSQPVPHQQQHQPTAAVNGTSNPSKLTQPPSSSSKLPSYLLPPSYPSLPSRNPSIPLSISGEFTNTHFRTLHIIHAKSQRPRFHAPKRIRPAIRRLLGWKMEVDESDWIGLGISGSRDGGTGTAEGEGEGEGGLFEWTLGTTEAAVLERFMQEVEFGHVCAGTSEIGGNGKVRWGWRVEELARYLGMIVVGEAVRAEEGGR